MKPNFTNLQRRVIKMVCANMGRKHIAEKLGRHPGTVDKMIDKIHKKMGVSQLVEFAQYALHHKLARNIYEK